MEVDTLRQLKLIWYFVMSKQKICSSSLLEGHSGRESQFHFHYIISSITVSVLFCYLKKQRIKNKLMIIKLL